MHLGDSYEVSKMHKNVGLIPSARYGAQLDAMLLLKRISEHFASSALSLFCTRAFHAVRVIGGMSFMQLVLAYLGGDANCVRKMERENDLKVSLSLTLHCLIFSCCFCR